MSIAMNINADYSQRVVINHHDLPLTSSPEAGVERRMLDQKPSNESAQTFQQRGLYYFC